MDDIQIVSIHSGNWEEFEKELKDFCMESDYDDSPAARNVSWNNWMSNPASLMHTLVIQKRYDPTVGQFDLLIKDGKPIACSGCYLSDWSNKVMVLGARTWTVPFHRTRWWHGDMLLPRQLEVAKAFGCTAAVMSFNEYNNWLLSFIKRITTGRGVTLGYKHPEFYKGFVEIKGYFNIKNTKQTLMAKLLTCTLEEFQEKFLPPEYEDDVSSLG